MRALAAPLLVHHVHVGVRRAEGDHPAAVPAHVPVQQTLVRRHDGRAVGELLDQLGLGGGHVFDGADQLEVHRGDVGDDAHVRQRHPGQLADLPGAAHGHLHDGDLGVGLDLEQRERHADLVVQIGAGGHGARDRPQQRRQDVLGRRLAGAAGDADDLDAGAAADGAGQLLEGAQAVVDDDARRGRRQRRRGLGAHHDRRRAAGEGGRRVLVAVERLALQRDEQVAGPHAAAVGADTPHLDVGVGGLEAAAAGGRDLAEGQRQHRLTSPRAGGRALPPPPRSRRRGSCGRR